MDNSHEQKIRTVSTSMSKNNSILEQALAGIDARFRNRIIESYLSIKRHHQEERYDSAGLSIGKFCETVLRFSQHVVIGNFTPFGRRIPNFADDCRAIVAASSNAPESLKTIIPRALVLMYTMRNKRGIGHVGGDVDANRIDSATLTRIADWVVCELIRVYHTLSLEDAQDLVDGLAQRETPDIWEVGGKKRVLRDGLNAQDQTLLLLYSETTQAVLAEDLFEWVEYTSFSMYRTRVLKPLHSRRLIEYDAAAEIVHLSPKGISEVEVLLRDR